MRHNGGPQTKSLLKPIQRVQNQCLRKIAGAYKRTPIAALERECAIPPVPLYIEKVALQRAAKTALDPVKREIANALNDIWSGQAGRRRNARHPPVPNEVLQGRAKDRKTEAEAYDAHRREREQRGANRGQRPRSRHIEGRLTEGGGSGSISRQWGRNKRADPIDRWAELEWRRQWLEEAKARKEATWRTPWETPTLTLYEGLTKPEATALFLLRTEVIGLNAWLAAIGVPGVLPRCPCGWANQTVHHILLWCPQFSRGGLIAQSRSERTEEILGRKKSAQAAARWLIETGVLAQFQVAKEISKEDTSGYRPFQQLEEW
jgi:hypothetical protein